MEGRKKPKIRGVMTDLATVKNSPFRAGHGWSGLYREA